MRSLHRAVRTIDRGGTALPVPFLSWGARQVTVRRGEVTMIAGQPGAGKSTTALALAVKMRDTPCLYACADSHEATMALRTLSMVTEKPQAEIEPYMNSNPEWAAAMLKDYASHIKWMFDASPSLQDLEDSLNVYRELQGDNPHLVVLDNAMDFTHDVGDPWESLRSLMREVKWWARETNAAFLVLHHTSENHRHEVAPSRAALHGKIAAVPSLILTLGTEMSGKLAVAPVKNRYGPADPSGYSAIFMDYDPAMMTLRDASA